MLKYLDEYRDTALSLEIAKEIRRISTQPFNIMEVCGGHTMAIRKNGLQKIVGDNINLISGPGCPVCVTSKRDIDKAIAASLVENATVCTFGDMMYVPGSVSSLAGAKASGKDVRTVYSAYDAVKFAESEPLGKIIFVSIGFETTTPPMAAAVKECERKNIKNFYVLALNKTMPRALRAVLGDKSSKINALILPGHVSTITGMSMYSFLADELGVSGCVSGFEPVDILKAVYILAESHERDERILANAYERAVHPEGNLKAKNIMSEVFEEADTEWRGFGVIPKSGLKLRDKYASFDAEKVFNISVPAAEENKKCICGDILRGKARPQECELFKRVCNPLNPQGACMVSSEGTCAAWFRYE